MVDETVILQENSKVNDKYYKLVFRSSALARNVKPGQFVNVKIEEGNDPFLRRPFSYYRVDGDRIEILYEVLGRGTGILSRKPAGSKVSILGPLGKTFSVETSGKKRILVAGGIGLPPLVFLAERYGTDYLLIGAKSKLEVMPEEELRAVRGKVLYSTNDGSFGKPGFVTVLLEELFGSEPPQDLFVQTCGPKVMMQAVMDLAARYGVQGEASIDESMACGVGACLGCMVETDKGLLPSCVEGPVFGFDRIRQRLV